ncbi:hypothetical protein Hte_011597 [Hypoxylon texense]
MPDFDVRIPMSDNYKRLLPAPMPPGSAEANASEASFPKETGPPVKKRTVSKAACNNCRLKKIRCDGKRPSCTACTKAGVECNFVTASSDETPFMALKREVESLRRSTEDILELFDLLESAPEARSLDILRRLKSTGSLAEVANDPSDVLASVKKDLEDDHLLPVKLSNRQLMAGLIPETQQTPEYELMMRCPTAYPMLMPVEIAFLNLADLLRPAILERPTQTKLVLRLAVTQLTYICSARQGQESTTSSSATPPAGPSEGTPRSGMPSTLLDTGDPETGNFEHLQSLQGIIDDRLKGVNFQGWTKVPIPNELAATLVSMYLEIDHPWCPLFDADLFLNDCVQGKTHFCSSLLVNALLAWACQTYSNLLPDATQFAAPFESEAGRLWATEKINNTLTAVAAAQLLNSTSSSQGRDDYANQILDEGIEMGRRMGLFGVGTENASALIWLDHHQDWLRAACHTSWGIFSCACMRSLHLHRAEIDRPPMLPMPGEYFDTHGYSNVGFPPTRALVPTRVGATFRQLCKLNVIVHDIIWEYFGKSDVVPALRASIPFAERIYQRLFQWAAELPLELGRGRRNRHSTLMLHLYYHCTVMELFWPFLQQEGNKPINVAQLTSTSAAMKDIHEASVNQLKRLALIYCINFNKACTSTLWHIALLYLANAMLCETMRSGEPRDSELRYPLILYSALPIRESPDGSFQVVEVTMLGLLSMSLRNGFLSSPEANTVLNYMRTIGRRYDAQFTVRASFMVDLELAMTNPKEAQVQTLAEAFHELAIFREFTTGEFR